MDGLADLLDGPRSRGAFVLRVLMEPPFGVRIEDRAPLTVVAMTGGVAWLLPDDDEPVRLEAGDVALVRGPAPYAVADDPTTESDVVIGPDQSCSDPSGRLVDQSMALGVRTWGNSRDGATSMLVGTWNVESEVSRPLLTALPRILVRRSGEWDDSLVELLVREAGREAPGQSAEVDRMLDLVLLGVVRSYLAEVGPSAGVALGISSADPVVGHVLRLVHEAPEQPWTLARLAHSAGSSRAVLARRFHELVGEPPIAYLTRWRLARAADLLVGTGQGLEQVARQVGYGSPFALSTAFKREYGVSPRAYRQTHLRDVGAAS